MKADSLRRVFLNYFKAKEHKIVSSDSLVPEDDPTILFTPAGMNQFKKEFLNPKPKLKRAASSQRCLRTDDLEKVGKTSGHHTFFEMLGNFSFGDYFKRQAIVYAWEFLTQVLKIKEEKLWASVYQDDQESYDIWRGVIKIPISRIVKLGDKENFWPSQAKQNGPDGPCGPCSEIFFDQGANLGCKKSNCDPSCSCERFVEVWNLVFTQFNRKQGGILEPLPKKNIDTGMGLERLAAVMQGVKNNFETDLFKPLTKEIVSGLGNYEPENKGFVFAVTDHLRAIVFAVFDGVMPSNESRGYVVRKLIRKSTLHLKSLGLNKPYIYKLVPILTQIMKDPYPELVTRRENIAEIILSEEKAFINILDSSDTILDKLIACDSTNSEIAFVAFDTYGIPVQMAWDYLKKKGKNPSQKDEQDFNRLLDEQKSRSKLQSTMRGNVFDIKNLDLGVENTKVINDDYKNHECEAAILKIIKDNQEIEKINKGDQAKIILDKTVFYPESGGQIGDAGELMKGKNVFTVLDTKKLDSVIIHLGKVKQGSFKKSDILSAKIDSKRRLEISRNHTATHLLQAALRQVLGPHVQQQGSLVAQDKLRFDFTHFQDISNEELDRIEEIVNSHILKNYLLKTEQMPVWEAKKAGALAFFGEKYTEQVRVVLIANFSKELCGGAHLHSTGQIERFKIISESSVASGVRRIEAQTGSYAYKAIKKQEEMQEAQERLKKMRELEKQQRVDKLKNIKKNIEIFFTREGQAQGIEAETIKNINVITYNIESADMSILRKAVDLVKNRSTTNTIVACGTSTDNALLVLGVTSDLCDKKGIDASKLIKQIASETGGSGGGRKDFAQAGGNKPANLKAAFKKLKEML
jgi:alanyl-tRNA synthetase